MQWKSTPRLNGEYTTDSSCTFPPLVCAAAKRPASPTYRGKSDADYCPKQPKRMEAGKRRKHRRRAELANSREAPNKKRISLRRAAVFLPTTSVASSETPRDKPGRVSPFLRRRKRSLLSRKQPPSDAEVRSFFFVAFASFARFDRMIAHFSNETRRVDESLLRTFKMN